jgi:ABC-type spermidine/putrescine transport system permease subunit II
MFAQTRARQQLAPLLLAALAAITAGLAIGKFGTGTTVKRYEGTRAIVESSSLNGWGLLAVVLLAAAAVLGLIALWALVNGREPLSRKLLLCATAAGIPAIVPALLSLVAFSLLVRQSRSR